MTDPKPKTMYLIGFVIYCGIVLAFVVLYFTQSPVIVGAALVALFFLCWALFLAMRQK